MGDSPPVATFNHLAYAKSVMEDAPSWVSMCDALDAEVFKVLLSDTNATALGLSTCNAVVSHSPSLAYHIFSANSNDPAKLGVTLAFAMNTAHHSLNQLGQAPGAVVTGPPTIMPVS
jgi:hypothetical protein